MTSLQASQSMHLDCAQKDLVECFGVQNPQGWELVGCTHGGGGEGGLKHPGRPLLAVFSNWRLLGAVLSSPTALPAGRDSLATLMAMQLAQTHGTAGLAGQPAHPETL